MKDSLFKRFVGLDNSRAYELQVEFDLYRFGFQFGFDLWAFDDWLMPHISAGTRLSLNSNTVVINFVLSRDERWHVAVLPA